jgi:hypothetical protein
MRRILSRKLPAADENTPAAARKIPFTDVNVPIADKDIPAADENIILCSSVLRKIKKYCHRSDFPQQKVCRTASAEFKALKGNNKEAFGVIKLIARK